MVELGDRLGVAAAESDRLYARSTSPFRHLQSGCGGLDPCGRISAYDCSCSRTWQVDGPTRLAWSGLLMCFWSYRILTEGIKQVIYGSLSTGGRFREGLQGGIYHANLSDYGGVPAPPLYGRLIKWKWMLSSPRWTIRSDSFLH